MVYADLLLPGLCALCWFKPMTYDLLVGFTTPSPYPGGSSLNRGPALAVINEYVLNPLRIGLKPLLTVRLACIWSSRSCSQSLTLLF